MRPFANISAKFPSNANKQRNRYEPKATRDSKAFFHFSVHCKAALERGGSIILPLLRQMEEKR